MNPVAQLFLLGLRFKGAARLPFVPEIQIAPRSLPGRIFLAENFFRRRPNRTLLVIHAQVRTDEFAGHSPEPQIPGRS
jgi:hypothetical protein